MKSVKLSLIAVFLVFSIISIGAVSVSNCKSLEAQKSLIIGKTLPDKAPFSDEIINIYIENETFGNIVLENKTLKSFSCIENQSATYKIYIKNTSVINDFMNSDDFMGTYKNKTSSGEIEVKGVGLGKKIKLGFVKFFLNFA